MTPRFYSSPLAGAVIAIAAIVAMVVVVLMARDDLPTINWIFVAGLVSISALLLTVLGIYNSDLSKRLDTLQAEMRRQGDRLDSLHTDMQDLIREVRGPGDRVAGFGGAMDARRPPRHHNLFRDS